MLKLEGQKRESGTGVEVKKELKAVVYGPHMDENITLTVPYTPFIKVYREAGTSQIIILNIDGEEREVMIKDFQLNPVTDDFIHVDFYAVTRGEEMEVTVPFAFIGEAPALKGTNVLNKIMSEIKIKSMPRDIPAEIEIDLSVLKNAGDAIRLSDVKLSEGVSFSTENLDEVIISVSEVKEEVEETTEETPVEGAEVTAEEKTEE